MNHPSVLSEVFMQEFKFGGFKAPAVVWGIALGASLVAVAGAIWIYQYNKN